MGLITKFASVNEFNGWIGGGRNICLYAIQINENGIAIEYDELSAGYRKWKDVLEDIRHLKDFGERYIADESIPDAIALLSEIDPASRNSAMNLVKDEFLSSVAFVNKYNDTFGAASR